VASNIGMRRELSRVQNDNAQLRAGSATVAERASGSNVQPQPPAGSSTGSGRVTAPDAPKGPPQARTQSESKRRVNAEEMAAMVKSPVLQKILASQTAAVIEMTYARLIEHLRLLPEERDYFQRLLVEKQSNVQNLGMQFMNSELSAEERQKLASELQAAWTSGEAKIREFLNNESDFDYYRKYNQQEPERKEVGMFEASLATADALDAATADALATLQSEARKNFPFTIDFYDQRNFGNPAALNTAAVQRFLDEQSKFQTGVAEKAAALLTPAQLDAYKQNQAAVRQMTNMQLTSIVQMATGR
jgi:hypothetical protein